MSYPFEIPCFCEKDGKLGAFELEIIPGFQANRIFYIFDVPEGQNRGDHACMNAAIVFLAIAGSVTLYVEETSGEKTEYILAHNSQAVYISPGAWTKAYNFSQNAILIGISDKKYQDCNYMNDYQRYINFLRGERCEQNSSSWGKRLYSQKSSLCLKERLSRI